MIKSRFEEVNYNIFIWIAMIGFIMFVLGFILNINPLLIGFGLMFFVFASVILILDIQKYYHLYGSRVAA